MQWLFRSTKLSLSGALLCAASGAAATCGDLPLLRDASTSDLPTQFVVADPDTLADVRRAVFEYYAAREAAVLDADTTDLFARYPELGAGADLSAGINIDRLFVGWMNDDGQKTRVEVDVERLEPLRVFVNGTAALAYVHGRETWHYPRGGPGSGEFYTRIELMRGADGWRPVLVDQTMLSERPPRLPRP